MNDDQDKTAEQLATEINSPQIEQADPADDGSQSPAHAPATSDELILGKFRSVDELAHSYQELERNYTASRQARTTPTPPVVSSERFFDEPTEQNIQQLVDQRLQAKLELDRATKFARDHKEDLADPLLRAAVKNEIAEANERGEYMDQETALANAKRALEERLAPKVAKVSQESFEEGKSLSRRREQAGAVGGTNAATPQVNPDELSAEEYAEYMGLNRI